MTSRSFLFAAGILACAARILAADGTRPTILEIEAFRLTKAKVSQMQTASGKKIVYFPDAEGRAEAKFKLPRGWYVATLYVCARSEDSASTRLMIEAEDYDAGLEELPVRPWETGKIAPCYPMKFQIADANRERTILLRPDDPEVRLDRLEIRPAR
jgi:hypothetical protein